MPRTCGSASSTRLTLPHGPSILIPPTAARKSPGSSTASTSWRNVRFGRRGEHRPGRDLGAVRQRDHGRPAAFTRSARLASRWRSAPAARPAEAIAPLIAPIPPITWPKNPCLPRARRRTAGGRPGRLRCPAGRGRRALAVQVVGQQQRLGLPGINLLSMNWPRLPVAGSSGPRASRPRTPRSRRPRRSSSRPPRRPVARVSGGRSRNRGCSRAASAFSSASAARYERASAGENRSISAAVRAGSFHAATTSPPSRATWKRRLARHHPQPVRAQVQLPDHLGPQHGRDVGGGRCPAAGGDLLGDAASAHHLTPLEHQRGQASPGEQRPGGEPVVPGADHDDVPSGAGLRGSQHL